MNIRYAGWGALLLLISLLPARGACQEPEPTDPPRLVMLGVTFGNPSVINLEAGYVGRRRGIRISGAYYGEVRGVQLNAILFRWGRGRFHRDLSLVGGHGMLRDGEWNYGGAAFCVDWGGLFLELALTAGGGNLEDLENSDLAGFLKLGIVPMKQLRD